MRVPIGTFAGIVVAMIVVFAVEFVGHAIWPPPPGLDINDPADLARLMEVMPAAAMAFVLLAWFLGALAGAWVANRIAGQRLAGWTVAVLAVVAAVATMMVVPHPAWMWAGGIALPLLAGWIAGRMAGRRGAA